MRNKDIDSIAYLLKRAKDNNQPKPIVFLGAGASISAGIPGSAQIIKDILKKFKDKPEVKNLGKDDRTYYNLMGCLNTEERHELLRNYISNEDVKINVTHIYLAQMLKEGYVDYVLTVNFDDLFLRACALFNFIPPVYDISILKDFTTTNLTEKSVTYLHGQHHGFWLLNTDEELEKVKEYIPTVFDRICNKRTWIIVGYSGEDPIFDQIARLGHFTNELFWVGYNDNLPNDNILEALIKKPNSNASLVSGYDADSFFLKLHSELKLDTPDIFNKPFSFLKGLMANIRDIDDLTSKGEHQKLFEKVKERSELALKQVEASIKQYEESDPTGALTTEDINRDKLKQKLIEVIVKNEFDNAEELLKQADLNDPEFKALLSTLFNNWGLSISKDLTKEQAERHKQAIEKYSISINLNDKNGYVYNNYGASLYQISQKTDDVKLMDEAIINFKKAVELTPEIPGPYFNWGVVLSTLARKEKNVNLYLEAIEKYKKAIALNHKQGSGYLNISNALLQLSKLQTGEESMNSLIEGKKMAQKAFQNGESAYNLACSYALLNNKRSALNVLNDVLDKKQISIEDILNDDDWKAYRDDDDWKSLIEGHKSKE